MVLVSAAEEVILPAEEGKLLRDGLITETTPGGWRKVHCRLLADESDLVHRDTPLIPISTVKGASVGFYFKTIPAVLVSAATVEYVGFNETMAKNIWLDWVCRPFDVNEWGPTDRLYGVEFMTFIIDAVAKQPFEEFVLSTDDALWLEIMHLHGLNIGAQVDILLRKGQHEDERAFHENVVKKFYSAKDLVGRVSTEAFLQSRQRLLTWHMPLCEMLIKENIERRFLYLKTARTLSMRRGGRGVDV
ncbi:hypothetical protein EsDP_00000695 [Epichloe bromicola]|uniref:Uncharacterized protein n=1 Tax=Epichloe bromicola TaxID=79588 RepID=A0ABQ0CFP0_9HYPO